MPRRFRRSRRLRRPRRKIVPRSLTTSSKIIKCNVVESFAPTFAGGALGSFVVQGNSIDDPFSAQSTNQPLGYDQWKALYKKAKVLSCKVIMTVHNGSTGAFACGITPMAKNQGATLLTDFEHYVECPGTKYTVLSPDVDKTTIVARRSTKKMLKISNIKDASEIEFDLVTETPPTDNYYFHCWAQPFDKTTALTGYQVMFKVEYIVLLYDPIIPARSSET